MSSLHISVRDLAIALKIEGKQDFMEDLLELYSHKILMILLISVSIERALRRTCFDLVQHKCFSSAKSSQR